MSAAQKPRPDLAVSAYGHPSSGGAGEHKLHRGTPPLRSATGADLDQFEPDPLDQAVDPVQCSLVEEIASQQCVQPSCDRVPARKPPNPARIVSPRRPPDADLVAEH